MRDPYPHSSPSHFHKRKKRSRVNSRTISNHVYFYATSNGEAVNDANAHINEQEHEPEHGIDHEHGPGPLNNLISYACDHTSTSTSTTRTWRNAMPTFSRTHADSDSDSQRIHAIFNPSPRTIGNGRSISARIHTNARRNRRKPRARTMTLTGTAIVILLHALCLSNLPLVKCLMSHNRFRIADTATAQSRAVGGAVGVGVGTGFSERTTGMSRAELLIMKSKSPLFSRNSGRGSSISTSSSDSRNGNTKLGLKAGGIGYVQDDQGHDHGHYNLFSSRQSNKKFQSFVNHYSASKIRAKARAATTKLHMINYIELFTDQDKSSDETTENSRWLSWMTGGTPRGVADVKMRDPVALGGVPRSNRYASRDWLHNTINLPNSAILKDIQFPVVFMFFWGSGISLVHRYLLNLGRVEAAMHMCIPLQPHSLMVSALGLLLVFRTNSAYQRFAEGRKIWEEILSVARDLSRLITLYEKQIGTAKLRRCNRLLAAFPYLLRFRIRPNSIMRKLDDPDVQRKPETSLILYQDHATSDSDIEAAAVASDEEITGISRRKPRELYWVDKSTLPWRLLPSKAMEECARAQNRPLWVCDRLSKELHSVEDQDNWTARERLTLLSKVEKLSGSIGSCERIHQTVVPLNYARHALRSLTMWLLSLPFALVKDLGLLTGPILFIISWMLFGVYEIGYSIEDPFQGTLRLSILCDAIRRDVLGDELIRNTAFTLDKEAKKADLNVKIKETKAAEELDYYEEEEYDDDDEDMEDADADDMAVQIEEIIIDELGNIVEEESQQSTAPSLSSISKGSSRTTVNGETALVSSDVTP